MIWLTQLFFRTVLPGQQTATQRAVGNTLLGLLAFFPMLLAAQTPTPPCPVIGPVKNLTICGDQPLNITICVTSTAQTGIQLAVFAQSVSDPYSQAGQMVASLGEAPVQSGTACIAPSAVELPVNSGTTPIDYFMYACLKPDPNDQACFATSFSVAKLTVLPKGCTCPPARCVPVLVQKITKK